jgi:hypothetical protein
MNHIYAKTLPKLLNGAIAFNNGIRIDLLIQNQVGFDYEYYHDIPASNRLGLPVSVPLTVNNGVASADPNPNNRIALFATPESTDLYGAVVYLPSGELLFYIEFGDIRHSKDGAFRLMYPCDLITLRVREV